MQPSQITVPWIPGNPKLWTIGTPEEPLQQWFREAARVAGGDGCFLGVDLLEDAPEEVLDEHDYLTYLNQGVYELRSGSAEAAIEYLDQAIRSEPEDEILFKNRRKCLLFIVLLNLIPFGILHFLDVRRH